MGEVDAADVRRIVSAGLAPYVGANMANASVAGHLDRLGVESGFVSPSQIATLLERIAPGLSVFIGPGRSAEVVDEIRRDLEHAGRGT